MTPKKRYDNKFFFTNVFLCCFWIQDPKSEIRDPGWVKIRIRDKHPGSATLQIRIHHFWQCGSEYESRSMLQEKLVLQERCDGPLPSREPLSQYAGNPCILRLMSMFIFFSIVYGLA